MRVELFGDIVEETRFFRVADQRSLGPAYQARGRRRAANYC